MSLRNDVREFIAAKSEDGKLFPYLYNTRRKGFNPDKDWVFYSGPYWDHDEPTAAITAFLSGKWLVSGEHVSQFEQIFSKKFAHKSSLMVNSGSSANLVMIAALKKFCGWQDGDEVVVSTVGFPTTVAPLVQLGLTPKMIDIDMEDLNFDLELVAKAMGPKTKAVFLSPVLGNTPDLDKLLDIVSSHDAMLIVDNCDSLGCKWKDKFLTEYGFASSTSFYPAHHISTGEGGMVSSNKEELVALARSIAWWGRDCYCVGSANLLAQGTCGNRFDKWLEGYDGIIDHKYYFTNLGYNLKPLDLQGAIGIQQLKKFDEAHEKRRLHKDRMAELFTKHIPGVRVPEEHEHAETGWFATPIICQDRKLKEQLVPYLEKNRIQTRNYFAGNIVFHPAYRHLADYRDFPVANRVLSEVFFVGAHPSYNDEVFSYVESVLKAFPKTQ